MRPAPAAIVIAAAIVVGVACGGTMRREARQQLKNDLSIRYSEIREWRREAGLDLEPHPQDVNQMRGVRSVQQIKAVCPSAPAVNATCADVCTLAEHICDNAESICDIAAQLEGDSWAADKCASAKASCRDAKKRCCTKCTETNTKASATW